MNARAGRIGRFRRELAVATAIVMLGAVMAAIAPGYFSAENLNDLFLANLPVLIIAIGMTLVILTGEIDISVGSLFAVCSVAAGVLAKTGLPLPLAACATGAIGAAVGAMNGSLTASVRIPSIVITLASMVALRDALRWATQGAWIQDLPPGFQWFGLTQSAYPFGAAAITVALIAATGWAIRHLAVGRAIYATGSNERAAQLAGFNTARIKRSVFALAGALTAVAAVLNAVRFNQIPSNSGLGLEMKVIAAVVVGGAAVRGGRGTLTGSVLGVILLGAIGPALTFIGITAYWERAIHGAIILVAVAADAWGERRRRSVGAATSSGFDSPQPGPGGNGSPQLREGGRA